MVYEMGRPSKHTVHTAFQEENLEETSPENLGIDGLLILKQILGKEDGRN
jgi:hypothetical protein